MAAGFSFVLSMLKSCKYCGRIHDSKFDCGKKQKAIRTKGDVERYRSSIRWQRKAEEIKERDNYLCQLCIREFEGTKKRINSNDLSVHHAIPMREDFEKREDNMNLITVCDVHHKLAEAEKIKREAVMKVIQDREYPPRILEQEK